MDFVWFDEQKHTLVSMLSLVLLTTSLTLTSAVNEVSPEGALQSFTVTPDGFLSSAIDTVPSGGDRPAYTTALSTGQIGVMDYNSGTGRIIPLSEDGLSFDDSAPSAGVITFPIPTAPTSEGVSHPHMILELGQEVLVPDLVNIILIQALVISYTE